MTTAIMEREIKNRINLKEINKFAELFNTDEMKEVSMTERLALYETAIEILGMMVAMRSEWIDTERQKNIPDKSLIKKWENEQKEFFLQDRNLLLHDSEKIEEIIAMYAPIIRREFAKTS